MGGGPGKCVLGMRSLVNRKREIRFKGTIDEEDTIDISICGSDIIFKDVK